MNFYGLKQLNFDIQFDNAHIKMISAGRGLFLTAFPSHMHPFFELHYIIKGKGTLVLDDTSFELSAGDLFFTAPKIYHAQLTDPDDNMEEYHISFEFLSDDKTRMGEVINFFIERQFYVCRDNQNIKALFEEMEKEASLQQVGFSSAVPALLQLILLKTARNYYRKNAKMTSIAIPDERRHLLLDEAFLYSYKDLTLQSLAELLHLDIRQIQRIIYKRYGMSFVELRTHYRLSAAQNMIEGSSESLLKIAEKCGYDNYAYFTKLFKQKFGVLPSEYRKTKRKDLK